MAGTQRVGFIGLGTMGKPMAKRVLQGGYPLTVYDVVRAPVEELAPMGATAANSPREVAQASGVAAGSAAAADESLPGVLAHRSPERSRAARLD